MIASNTSPSLNLITLFNYLSEIPLQFREFKDRDKALRRITELGREAMGSHACTLTFLDFDNRSLSQVAGYGFDMGSNKSSEHIDFDLLAKGEVLEMYNLQVNGQGVANPEVAQKYNLHSLLSWPLKSEARLIGYINHFSAKSDPFTEEEKNLLEIFAHQTMTTIEKLDYNRIREHSLSTLNELTQDLLTTSPERFLKKVSEKACELFSVPVCIVWKLDEEATRLRVVAANNAVDEAYKKIELNPEDLHHLSHRGVVYLSDVTKGISTYQYPNEAIKRGWVSLLSAPMLDKGRLTGILDVYTKRVRYFREWEKELFGAIANYAAIPIQQTEQRRESIKLEKLPGIMLEMAETHKVDDLLALLLQGSLEIVGAPKGAVCRLDHKTGNLDIVAPKDGLPKKHDLTLDKGITSKSLLSGRPIRVADVTSSEWKDEYVQFWNETRSELAIPMVVTNALVRIGRNVEKASKPIGVLNIESPYIRAFSKLDEDCLWSLARQAATRIERYEFDEKLANLREIEKEIVGERDYDQIIGKILTGITNTLGFEYVNISLVVPELHCIRTEYVTGIPDKDVDQFKRMATHSLDSNDIQADIVRSGNIEVPSENDPRFDRKIYSHFHHNRLVRVFIPMKRPTDNKVIGTVEAGYEKKYRTYIYEPDVQILQGFVDYAVHALEQKRSDRLDKIMHEFRTPIVGVRSNASFLQRRIEGLPSELVGSKFNDILTDCEILLYQVGELEYTLLGRTSRPSKRERTLVYRDIVIKTINQLKPIVTERGFSYSKITYNPADSSRIILYLHKAKLNQVVFNLLTNSIKYAEKDPNKFGICIEVDETRNSYILKFKDWGIGIKDGLETKIFEDGFRTPEAIHIDVTGSGLGLTIAKKIMDELGGDLKLVNNRKPTEFHIVLPKKLREVLL